MAPLVSLEGDYISVSVSSLAEAKLAVKEIKLLKKGFALKKREVASQIKELRFAYSQEVKARGSMVRGGGGLGRFARAIQASSRDARRASLAADLHPIEIQKHDIEDRVYALDKALLKLEVYMHDAT